MNAFAIVTGTLFRAPEARNSKGGRPFVVATIRCRDGDSLQWWRVVAFSEIAQTELVRIAEGDALTVQGPFKVELYRPHGGEARISLSLIADRVIALRQPPRERAASAPQRHAWRPGDGPDDEIPLRRQQ